MLLFSDSSDVLALVERIKFNIEIQRVFSELYVCASEGQEERQRGAGEERQCEGKQTEERPGKISLKTRFYRCFQTPKKDMTLTLPWRLTDSVSCHCYLNVFQKFIVINFDQ